MRFNDGKASPQGMLVTGFMHADWRKGHCGHLYALLGGALVDVLNGVQVGLGWFWSGNIITSNRHYGNFVFANNS